MSEPINLEMLEHAIREANDIPQMPPSIVNTPRGPVLAMDYPGICSIGFNWDGCQSSVAVMIYDPKPPFDGAEGVNFGNGFISQMTTEQARNFGASLIQLADEIDGGTRQ